MDKTEFKKLMRSLKIKTPKDYKKEKAEFPCVVKPADQGSSVGVSIVRNGNELEKAIELAKKFSNKIIIEEYIEGLEVSGGVLGNNHLVALPVIEIRPKKEFFDYEAKYSQGMSEEIVPARISLGMTKKVQEEAVEIFKAIGGRGYARIDFIIRNEEPYVLEINTLPGLTDTSLIPKEAKAAGILYPELLERIINLGLE